MSQYAKEPGMTTSPHRVSHWAFCWATKAPGAAISAASNRRLRELEWRHASFHRTDMLATFSNSQRTEANDNAFNVCDPHRSDPIYTIKHTSPKTAGQFLSRPNNA